MFRRIRDTLGWLTGSFLGILAIGAVMLLPLLLVLWTSVALGVPWAITTQVRLYLAVAAFFDTLNDLLPAWAWFAMITLAWLAFLDLHVRWLVRDEFSKHLKSFRERKLP